MTEDLEYLPEKYDDLLFRVADPYPNAIYTPPGNVRIGGRTYVAATDGARVLLIEGSWGRYSERGGQIIQMVAALPQHAWRVDMARLRAWAGQDGPRCKACGGSGRIQTERDCTNCDGHGNIECNLGHMHDCPVCGGIGQQTQPCAVCHGEGMFGAALGTFTPHVWTVVDRRLLADVVHDLPGENVSVAIKGPGALVAFSGPGWRIIIRPLHKDADAAPSLRLDPYAFPDAERINQAAAP